MVSKTEYWSPKTFSSCRRISRAQEFELTDPQNAVRTKKEYRQKKIKFLFDDPNRTPDCVLHTFYTLARSADCDVSAMGANAGHRFETGSKTA